MTEHSPRAELRVPAHLQRGKCFPAVGVNLYHADWQDGTTFDPMEFVGGRFSDLDKVSAENPGPVEPLRLKELPHDPTASSNPSTNSLPHSFHQSGVSHIANRNLNDEPSYVFEFVTHDLVLSEGLDLKMRGTIKVDGNLCRLVDEVRFGIGNLASRKLDTPTWCERREAPFVAY